jgi:two-component system, cell cycle response regulator DivK
MAGEPILIVDDNPTNLKLVRVVLEEAGFQVRGAVDADEALAVLEAFRPRLILMDIQLPGMDGLALTRMLKANPSLRAIRIVGLTAFAMKGDEARILEAGCDGYLSKPVNTRELPAVVTGYLQGAPTAPGS